METMDWSISEYYYYHQIVHKVQRKIKKIKK